MDLLLPNFISIGLSALPVHGLSRVNTCEFCVVLDSSVMPWWWKSLFGFASDCNLESITCIKSSKSWVSWFSWADSVIRQYITHKSHKARWYSSWRLARNSACPPPPPRYFLTHSPCSAAKGRSNVWKIDLHLEYQKWSEAILNSNLCSRFQTLSETELHDQKLSSLFLI